MWLLPTICNATTSEHHARKKRKRKLKGAKAPSLSPSLSFRKEFDPSTSKNGEKLGFQRTSKGQYEMPNTAYSCLFGFVVLMDDTIFTVFVFSLKVVF